MPMGSGLVTGKLGSRYLKCRILLERVRKRKEGKRE